MSDHPIRSLRRAMPNAAALALLGMLCYGTTAQAASVVSQFSSGSDGWLIADITGLPGSGVAATWDAGQQRITTADVTSWTTYSAPVAYLGNQAAYYGGSFSFQLTDNLKDDNADTVATFGIASFGTVMYWFGGAPSTISLTTFTATLSPADTRWRLGGLPISINSGVVPTDAQFQAVLSAITALRINADWRTAGNDITALDNVALTTAVPAPEPSSAVLVLASLALLARRRR